MAHLIDKSALAAEIEKLESRFQNGSDEDYADGYHYSLKLVKRILNTLEVIDPYEQWVQYASIEAGIQAHAEIYSFNIESELFNQLTKEQQKLWRKEIEYACISGGYAGYSLAKDPRYKENLEVKEVDFEKELDKEWNKCEPIDEGMGSEFTNISIEQFADIAKHFFELGLKAAQKGEEV